MRYLMKQKLLAWGDDFTIKSEDGRDAFFVDGRAFSIGEKLSFQDMQGNELAFIRQKLLAWGPTFELYRGGTLFALVKKKLLSLFHHRFTIDIPGPNDLEAKGDLFDLEYAFTRAGAHVATVSKRFFAFRDTYGIDIAPGEDDILILASAVVIDMVCHDDKE